jgi:predicted DNA-binding transcriptional regulator YafY
VIEELDLDGPWIEAWCTLRSDERVFSVSRILSVSPV